MPVRIVWQLLVVAATLSLLVGGLWLIDHATIWAMESDRPDAARWTGRLLGSGSIAAGQAVLFGWVIYPIYGGPRRRLTAAVALGLSVLSVLAAAVVGLGRPD